VEIRVYNPADPSMFREVGLLVDTGAVYAIIPGRVLREVGIEPREKRVFRLANGQEIERDVGIAIIEYGKYATGATAVFGEEDDTPVLGVQALEGLGLEVDPLTKQLKPTALLLV